MIFLLFVSWLFFFLLLIWLRKKPVRIIFLSVFRHIRLYIELVNLIIFILFDLRFKLIKRMLKSIVVINDLTFLEIGEWVFRNVNIRLLYFVLIRDCLLNRGLHSNLLYFLLYLCWLRYIKYFSLLLNWLLLLLLLFWKGRFLIYLSLRRRSSILFLSCRLSELKTLSWVPLKLIFVVLLLICLIWV